MADLAPTFAKPTEPGFYWVCPGPQDQERKLAGGVYQVVHLRDQLVVMGFVAGKERGDAVYGDAVTTYSDKCQWCGPLPEPAWLSAQSNEQKEPAHWLAALPFAYRSGTNRCGEDAQYYCHSCGLELNGDEECGYVAAGASYANGEFAPCPRCGKENGFDREDGDW